MTLKGKLFGLFGVLALSASLISVGAVSAQSSTEDVHLSVVCDDVIVDLSAPGGNDFGTYNPITDAWTGGTGEVGLDLSVDVGCYLGSWIVNVEASPLTSPGNLPFPASTLSIGDAAVTTSTFSGASLTGDLAPDANNVSFNFSGDGSDPILETSPAMLFYVFPLGYDHPAPFVTEASYTGSVAFTPLQRVALTVQGNADYDATLTVTYVPGV